MGGVFPAVTVRGCLYYRAIAIPLSGVASHFPIEWYCGEVEVRCPLWSKRPMEPAEVESFGARYSTNMKGLSGWEVEMLQVLLVQIIIESVTV